MPVSGPAAMVPDRSREKIRTTGIRSVLPVDIWLVFRIESSFLSITVVVWADTDTNGHRKIESLTFTF